MTPLIPMTTTTDEAQRGANMALLPIGAFEQHGPCLPLATDTLIACAIAHRIAAKHDVMLLPPVTVSCSHEHAPWPGSVSISHRTLAAVVDDIAASLLASRLDKLVLINGHGGNYVLSNIVQEANAHRSRSMALFPRSTDWQQARQAAGLATNCHEDMHAGELETSILLHVHPNAVRTGWQNGDHLTERPHMLISGMAPYTPTGVIGKPSLATSEKGEAIVESLTNSFAQILEALRQSE